MIVEIVRSTAIKGQPVDSGKVIEIDEGTARVLLNLGKAVRSDKRPVTVAEWHGSAPPAPAPVAPVVKDEAPVPAPAPVSARKKSRK